MIRCLLMRRAWRRGRAAPDRRAEARRRPLQFDAARAGEALPNAPRFSQGGWVVIDDYDVNYGHGVGLKGCRDAVQEFREAQSITRAVVRKYGKPAWQKPHGGHSETV